MKNTSLPISEKVKFWEEQDKINQALIPRIIELNNSLQILSKEVTKVDEKISASEARTLKKSNSGVHLPGADYCAYTALLLSMATLLKVFFM